MIRAGYEISGVGLTSARALVLGFLAACVSDAPAPLPTGVTPDRAFTGDETVIEIVGTRFYPEVEVDALDADAVDVDASFRAWLVGGGATHALRAVSVRDYEHIDAIVPAGIPPGRYDLRVENPGGSRGTLANAFQVTATRADRIAVEVEEQLVYPIFEMARVDLSLRDPIDQPVFSPMEVIVRVTPDVSGARPVFEDASLVDQQALDDGFGIRGRLGGNGRAQVAFTMGAPGMTTLTVEPVDEPTVAEGMLLLDWTSGAPSQVEIDLPNLPWVARAGTPFDVGLTVLDAFGNRTDDPVTVVLNDLCSSWNSQAFQVRGDRAISVTLRRATGDDDCIETRVQTLVGPVGASAAFTVSPGDADHYDVLVAAPEVRAGDRLNAVLIPVDAYGNRVVPTGASVTLTDSVGGVVAGDCSGVSTIFCEAFPTVAAPEVRLLVEDADGLRGESGTFAVLPADPAEVLVSAPVSATAGTPFDVEVQVKDGFGNPLDPMDWLPEDFVLRVAGVPGDCAFRGTTGANNVFECVEYVAEDAVVVAVELVGAALSGASLAFPVHNAPLDKVEIDAPSRVAAGAAWSAQLRGVDAWGNAFRVQDDAEVTLSDRSGSWTVSAATFDSSGDSVVSGSISVAGPTVLWVSRSGRVFGTSGVITVEPGSVSAIEVVPRVPWAFAGESAPFSVRAVDEWGNTVDVEGPGTLAAASGSGEAVSFQLRSGMADVLFVWDVPASAGRVEVDTALGTGMSTAVDVWERCSSGSTPIVRWAAGDGRVCWDASSASTPVAVDFSLSGNDAAEYRVAVDGSQRLVSDVPSVLLPVTRTGRVPVRGLVERASGCADEAVGDLWVGPDDGQAVGPLTLVAPETAAIGDSLVVRVEDVVDCAGDPASDGTLRFRAERGRWASLGSSGFGRTLTLDGDAEGEAVLLLDTDTGGETAIVAWSASGAAEGRATVTVAGDDRRPVVWELRADELVPGLVEALVLDFSEPLLLASLTEAQFAVSSESAALGFSVDVAGDARTVRLVLDVPHALDDGTLVVTAWSTAGLAIRDLAGNKLDGTFSGEASSFIGVWGVAGAGPDLLDCGVDLGRFTPDGDPGSGLEADAVRFDATAASTPAHWWVTVTGPDGAVRWRERSEASSHDFVWSWDGRDRDGGVVDAGFYRLTVDARDAFGNRGGACSAVVQVVQHAGY